MRKRRARSKQETQKTSIVPELGRVEGSDRGIEESREGFFACYLLTSLSPRHKGHTYIGFTVNPKRRIRQHNGEISSGAWRTKKKRPWEMVLCIYGFPTNVTALQFEWAWQHPVESLAVRAAAVNNFKSLGGLSNKIKLAFTMLTLHTWQSMDLTVNFFSSKYMQHAAGCPPLPPQINVQMGSMDDLPCYTGIYPLRSENSEEDFYHSGLQNPLGSSTDEDSLSQERLQDQTGHDFPHLNSTEIAAKEPQQVQLESSTHDFQEGYSFSHSQESLRWSSILNSQERTTEQRVSFQQASSSEERASSPSMLDHIDHRFSADVSPSSQESTITRDTCTSVEEKASNLGNKYVLIEEGNNHREKDHCLSANNSSSTISLDALMAVEDKADDHGIKYILIEEEIDDSRSPSFRRATNKSWLLPHEEVEVIDLFTPPDFRAHDAAGGKRKRRVCKGQPELIDLTVSPMFVQL